MKRLTFAFAALTCMVINGVAGAQSTTDNFWGDTEKQEPALSTAAPRYPLGYRGKYAPETTQQETTTNQDNTFGVRYRQEEQAVDAAQSEASPSDRLPPAVDAQPTEQPAVEPQAASSSDCNSCGPVGGCASCGSAGGCGCGAGHGDVYPLAPLATAVSTQLKQSPYNWSVGVRGLFFERDYEGDFGLSYSGADSLFSTDAGNNLYGVETIAAVRASAGIGLQFRYFGLFASNSEVDFGGSPQTNLTGLTWLTHAGTASSALDMFNTADSHQINRGHNINNFELNFIGNGGLGRSLLPLSTRVEWIAGFRFLRFDEDFRYSAYNSQQPTYPRELHYTLGALNELAGFQFGFTSETCLTDRLIFTVTTKVGIYNNHVTHDQCVCDEFGNVVVLNDGNFAGQDYSVYSEKDDVAVLGELDLGLAYQFASCRRLVFGYRAIGVGGVALAVDQIPYEQRDLVNAGRINANGSLLMHGAYLGLDFCF